MPSLRFDSLDRVSYLLSDQSELLNFAFPAWLSRHFLVPNSQLVSRHR